MKTMFFVLSTLIVSPASAFSNISCYNNDGSVQVNVESADQKVAGKSAVTFVLVKSDSIQGVNGLKFFAPKGFLAANSGSATAADDSKNNIQLDIKSADKNVTEPKNDSKVHIQAGGKNIDTSVTCIKD